jgi:hypothetical protein
MNFTLVWRRLKLIKQPESYVTFFFTIFLLLFAGTVRALHLRILVTRYRYYKESPVPGLVSSQWKLLCSLGVSGWRGERGGSSEEEQLLLPFSGVLLNTFTCGPTCCCCCCLGWPFLSPTPLETNQTNNKRKKMSHISSPLNMFKRSTGTDT